MATPATDLVDSIVDDVDDDEVETTIDDDETETETELTLKGYRQRTATHHFRKGDHAGRWVKTWINCPRDLINQLSSPDDKVSNKALCQFIVAHNLVWSNDQPLPTPLTIAAVKRLDIVLTNTIVRLGIEAIQKAAGVNPT